MVKLEKIDGSKVELQIEVSEDALAGALNEAYKKVVKKVNVPGFRKGKVPRLILENRFGAEILYEDAIDILIPDAYDNAVEETGINPIDRPEIDLVQIEKGKPFIFKAVVQVKPEVKLGEYRGLTATKEVREITETDMETRLNQLQKQHVKMHVVEDGTVELGDQTVIDFKGFASGEPFEGGSAEGYSLEVGSNTFIPGFEAQLIGMKLGEEKEIDVTFPPEYQSEELAGKPAMFKVTLHEIKRKELPELTDEFTQEISEFNTLAELKEDILNKLKEQEEERAKNVVKNKLVGAITDASEVPIPNILVERELDRMISEMEQFLRMQGMDMERFLSYTGKNLADFREEKREEAEGRVKGNLVLDAIIEKEGIVATDEEVEERINAFAESYKQDVQIVKDYFATQGQLDVIHQEIQFAKVIDFLVTEAQISTETAPEQEEE